MLESERKKIEAVEKALDGKPIKEKHNIGNDFAEEITVYKCFCSECHKVIFKGSKALVSRRNGKVQKRICSEECRLTFDDRFWRIRARKREWRGF